MWVSNDKQWKNNGQENTKGSRERQEERKRKINRGEDARECKLNIHIYVGDSKFDDTTMDRLLLNREIEKFQVEELEILKLEMSTLQNQNQKMKN